ncbi:MAG: CCA tRNA nucleotidyltransferase [Sphingomonas sp.]|uniref:CCA tRNA nucleotidyltransferase n=1 Tax=Sphingomonas sp. TaxID=28214 RepID=UPI0025F677BE|nr:CCA tRNA nucleotidyltransferase [Sphingomonas sp.]MBX3564300.1 CCA tRNA nucleotidyltransferase [Sphingomonas sp.]
MADMILPDAEWQHRAGLAGLVRVLGDVRFVGGCVRDTLLGIPVSDIDLATSLAPETVVEYLKEAGITAVPTGIAHGTVTAVIESGPVEVTTLRRDVSTDGRHATVAFTDNWREDAARRDFTMNALYADPNTREIFDYFGGLADLEARKVRFIGDPYQRIAEDHLRILRFFRFLARFGDEPDGEALRACSDRANDLMALSRERIRDELLKLLVARDAVRVVELMIRRRMFVPILFVRSAERLAYLAKREAEAGIAPDPIRRLAALIPPEDVETVGARFKLSNLQRRRLQAAVARPVENAKALVYRAGQEGAVDRLLLSERPIREAMVAATWEAPCFPLTGGAIIRRGIKAGPQVARLMRQIEDQWIAEDFPDSARVDQIADELVLRSINNS